MKSNIIILIFLLTSCSSYNLNSVDTKPYNSKGFAYIYSDQDYDNKLIRNKMNNELLQISNMNLKTGTLIKLINPKTKEYLVLKNLKKIKYPDFYKILITNKVASKLNIDRELPLVEILEVKKNKSFIAKKAKIYQEEKKIPSKAPVTSVKIANISKKTPNTNKINPDKIYILIASFYTNEAANLLKQRINKEAPNYNTKKIKIKKRSNKEFDVISGPYKSINLVKNDYISLKIIGFEELDIYINE